MINTGEDGAGDSGLLGLRVVVCFDSGEGRVMDFSIDKESGQVKFSDLVWMRNKHTNICLKCRFSPTDPNIVYTTGFDYKIVQWSLKDVKNKSQSRNIIDQMKQVLGA